MKNNLRNQIDPSKLLGFVQVNNSDSNSQHTASSKVGVKEGSKVGAKEGSKVGFKGGV